MPIWLFWREPAQATITGRDDCIARIKAYEKTGVDGITLIGAQIP
jgi:2-methylisocitrate lyase-like PEP mutase family enzyme